MDNKIALFMLIAITGYLIFIFYKFSSRSNTEKNESNYHLSIIVLGMLLGFIIGFLLGMNINPPFDGFWDKHPLSDDVRGFILVGWFFYGMGGAAIGAFGGLLARKRKFKT